MKIVISAVLAVMLVTVSAVGVSAQDGKIGFGFDPGLIAGKDYVPGQLIVGLRSGNYASTARQVAGFGGKILKKLNAEALLLELNSDADVFATAKALERLSEIAYIERNGIMRIPPVIENSPAFRAPMNPGIMSVSADAGNQYQWHLTVIRKTAVFADPATVPTVAVIDTGVDYNHPDLSASGKVIKGKNSVGDNFDPYDDNGHGTHVAGIIAGTGGNGQYGEGVCPACNIYAVKVLDINGSGTFFGVADGMKDVIAKQATYNIKVANMSLGGPESATVSAQVLAMKNAGIALAAAAGNDNSTDPSYAWPGADPNVAFRVMATEQNDCRAVFSNYNPSGIPGQFNISAPGYDILSTYPDAQYRLLSGTSMATPVVAGAAALVWGQFPSDTRSGLVTRIISAGASTACGFNSATKRVDVAKAMGVTETGVIGRLLDPFTGKATSPQTSATTAQLKSGTTVLSSDAANKGGFYEMTGLAAGTGRTLKGVKTQGVNDASLRTGIAITAGKMVGPYTDAFPARRATGDAIITLDWKTFQPVIPEVYCSTGCKLGWEIDVLVKLPVPLPYTSYIGPWDNCAGSSCTWSTGDLLTSPYVSTVRDSFDDAEPVEGAIIGSAAPDGNYEIVVFNNGDGNAWNPEWTGSRASVQIYNGAAPVAGAGALTVPGTCGSSSLWHVGTLTKNGTAYTWTKKNLCTDTLP